MLHRFGIALLSSCLTILGPASAALANGVGVAAQVATESFRTPADGDQRTLTSNDPVFLQDLIATDPSGAARLAMADDTVITIGPASRVTLDRFLYDPASNSGESVTRIAVGGMRFISGRMPSASYSVLTPTAVIGLRGTDITVQVNPVTQVTRVIVLVGEVVVRPTGCATDIVVSAGRMVDIAPVNACGAEQERAVPLPQWARGRMFPDQTTIQIGFDTPGNDVDSSNPATPSPGGSRGGPR